MSIFQAFILGAIQGITEFLPISSSGHLVIAQQFFQFKEPPVFFDIIVHVGTLLAVFVFFAEDIRGLNRHLIIALGIASVPTAIIGLLLKPYIPFMFQSMPLTIVGFAITSILLLSLRNRPQKNGLRSISPATAFIIGVAQGISIIPSISRSGATISAGLLRGINPQQAFTFSFLLSIPAIIGATLLELSEITIPPDFLTLGVGFIMAAITGFIALKILRHLLLHRHFYSFGIYTSLLTLALLVHYLLS